jgi:uncharacterized membrane protein YdfJ with MMPL/SSD domain
VAALVLTITFGSAVAAGLPLLTAALGVSVGIMGALAATAFTDLSSNTATLTLPALMAVVGARAVRGKVVVETDGPTAAAHPTLGAR